MLLLKVSLSGADTPLNIDDQLIDAQSTARFLWRLVLCTHWDAVVGAVSWWAQNFNPKFTPNQPADPTAPGRCLCRLIGSLRKIDRWISLTTYAHVGTCQIFQSRPGSATRSASSSANRLWRSLHGSCPCPHDPIDGERRRTWMVQWSIYGLTRISEERWWRLDTASFFHPSWLPSREIPRRKREIQRASRALANFPSSEFFQRGISGMPLIMIHLNTRSRQDRPERDHTHGCSVFSKGPIPKNSQLLIVDLKKSFTVSCFITQDMSTEQRLLILIEIRILSAFAYPENGGAMRHVRLRWICHLKIS